MKKSLLVAVLNSLSSYLGYLKYQKYCYKKSIEYIHANLFPAIKKMDSPDFKYTCSPAFVTYFKEELNLFCRDIDELRKSENRFTVYQNIRSQVRETTETWAKSAEIKPKHIAVYFLSEMEFTNPK